MKKGKVAIYIQSSPYAKPAYKVECYNARLWPGMEMIRDALARDGIEVEYCTGDRVADYGIILVSITAQCDWYTFIRERVKWPSGKYTVIAGGTGVLNIRPVLAHADVFIFGRGEVLMPGLVRACLKGVRVADNSICYADEFDLEKTYILKQTGLYPHEVTLSNGSAWKEAAVGCQNTCKFCSYTWHRRHTGGLQSKSGAMSDTYGNQGGERTLLEIDCNDLKGAGIDNVRVLGLDGFSERLRLRYGKPITSKIWRQFLEALVEYDKGHMLRIYNICGFPGETQDDWFELLRDIQATDASRTSTRQTTPWYMNLHSTPFRAMPATVAACWPMSYRDFRGRIAHVLKTKSLYPSLFDTVFYNGKHIKFSESWGTESLPTAIEDALCLRGTEEDAEILTRLACSARYWRASVADKMLTLEQNLDVHRLFRAYDWDEYPVRYLQGWAKLGNKRTSRKEWCFADPEPSKALA